MTMTRVRRLLSATAALALFGGIGLASGIAVTPASAADPQTRFVSTTGSDTDNDCTDGTHPCETIQYAVNQADAGDTVSIAAGTYAQSVRTRVSLTFVGAGTTGANDTRITGANTDDAGPSIHVDGTDTETAPVVTIKDLDVSGNSHDDGIYAAGAQLTVTDSVVSHNDDVGIDLDSGEGADTSAHVVDTTISGNGDAGIEVDGGSASVRGATIDRNADGGVVVEDDGHVDITTTTLDGNVGVGLVLDGGTTSGSLVSSTVSNTSPLDSESEPYGAGVLVFPNGDVTIENSTLDGNTGQGLALLGGSATVKSSTVAGTKPAANASDLPSGGLVSAVPDHPAGTLTATSTVVAGSKACVGTVHDDGYNLASDATCGFSASGSVNSGTTKLGPLADHGGATRTVLPAKDSDAIDAIPTGKSTCLDGAKDQRGVARPQGPRCDVGAVEVAQTPLVVSPTTLPAGTVGEHYRVQLKASGGLGAPYTFSLKAGESLPPGLHLSPTGVVSGVPSKAGHFEVTVSVDDPVLVSLTIRIRPAAASPSPSPVPAPAPEPGPPSNGGGSTLPDTGAPANAVPLAWLAGGAICLGAVLMVTGSRRRQPRHLAR